MKQRTQWLVACALLIGVLYGRMLYQSHQLLQQGKSAAAAGQKEEAILLFGQAAHMYAPGNPYVGESLEWLWKIGQEAEAKNQIPVALTAYDSMRGSIYAIRGLNRPHRAWLEKINPKIASLRASKESYATHLKSLQKDERPDPWWSLAAVVGFLGWIGAVVGWIWRGFDREGKMNFRGSLPWMIGLVLFFAVWVVGLVRA